MSRLLTILREKREFLLEQEALAVDAEQKFSLKKQIEGIDTRIKQVESGQAIGTESAFEASLESMLLSLQSERRYHAEKTDDALQAINEALIETARYIEEFGGDKCADRGIEFRLAKLWADASVKARHASPDFAKRFNDKSDYWRGAVEWSREEVLAKKVDFASIEATVAEMLAEAP